jgi:formylglycine-generating enzyme required for sulfatase activity
VKPAVGLADLVRLLRALPARDRADAAALLGFRRIAGAPVVMGAEPAGPVVADSRVDGRPAVVAVGAGIARVAHVMTVDRHGRSTPHTPPPRQQLRVPNDATPHRMGNATIELATASAVDDRPADRAGFFRVEAATEREREPPTAPALLQRLTEDDLRSEPCAELPESPPLAAWSTLWSRLHAALHGSRPSRDPDVATLIRAWARGEHLPRIPRSQRRVWTASAALWIDRSSRLTPFWDDQEMVYRQLVRLCGHAAIERRVLDAHRQASLATSDGDLIGSRSPDPAVPVLVLGDLGFYGTDSDRACWLRTVRRLRRAGVRVAAMVPCPTSRWDHEIARAWNATVWERASAVDDRRTPETRAEALLRLVAPTALVQPGLLRALRRLLPAAEADASTEVDVWRHTDVLAADATGLVLEREASARWRARFAADVPEKVHAEVRRLIEHWHGRWRAELLHAEALAWAVHGLPGELGRMDEARAFFKRVEATLCSEAAGEGEVAAAKHYGRHLLGALPDQGFLGFPELKNVWAAAFADLPYARLPSTIEPHELFVRTPRSPRQWTAYQRADRLVLVDGILEQAQPYELGSPVATLSAGSPEVWVRRGNDALATRTRLTSGTEVPLRVGERVTLRSDGGDVVIDVWVRAPWAVAAGRDRYGLWAAFEVKGVQQRLRWIPPGRFLMGSPPSEAQPKAREGPQHWVTIDPGLWLGQTPVTQALWRAVMAANPSKFMGRDQPVEQVSWTDCQDFIRRLNRMLDGFAARLPTEAEWERACRAGTAAATSGGGLAQPSADTAPELDTIAWYDRNSGVLEPVEGGNGWPRGAGTQPVGRLRPNRYGLHDMLGNVYEWCQDRAEGPSVPYPYPYRPEHVDDPEQPAESRVIRGGSWFSPASAVRAAHRTARASGSRRAVVGFRIAGGEVSSP